MMKTVAKELREEDAKKNTQARIGMLLGVSRECVSKWFTRDMQVGTSTNTHKAPTAKPDARTTLTKEGKAKVVEEVNSVQYGKLLRAAKVGELCPADAGERHPGAEGW